MRVALIAASAPSPAEKPFLTAHDIPAGIGYVGGALQAAGHEIGTFVCTRETNESRISDFFDAFRPDLACFTGVSRDYSLLANAAGMLSELLPETFLLAGGAHAMVAPAEVIRGPFHAVCVGEGEHATLELVSSLTSKARPRDLAGMWMKAEESTSVGTARPFVQDLDSLTRPVRKEWTSWVALPEHLDTVLASRGCPYMCSYCCNHVFKKLSTGRYVRFRQADAVVAEILDVWRDKPTLRSLFIESEALNLDKLFLSQLCQLLNGCLDRGLRLPKFGGNVRIAPGQAWDKMFGQMRAANFTCVKIGIESGSPKIRNAVLNRRYSNVDVKRAVSAAKRAGLWVTVYVMIGITGESRDDFAQTLELLNDVDPDSADISVFEPYPGTALHQHAQEAGLLGALAIEDFSRGRATIGSRDFSVEEIDANLTLVRHLYPLDERAFIFDRSDLS